MIQIYNADCLEKMKDISDKSIDMILCDLPYGTTACKWDTIIPFDKLWEQYNRVIKDRGAIVLFAQCPFDKVLGCSNLKNLKYEWIWEKTQATGHLNSKKMPMKAHENILIFYKKPPIYNPQKTYGHKPAHSYVKRVDIQNKTNIYGYMGKEIIGKCSTDRFPRSVQVFSSDKQKCKLADTQKPVALCRYLIRTYTNENDLVLDNCMGSGSTGMACIEENRRFIGIEKDKEIFDTASNRLNIII